jgi:hypothetical protein
MASLHPPEGILPMRQCWDPEADDTEISGGVNIAHMLT